MINIVLQRLVSLKHDNMKSEEMFKYDERYVGSQDLLGGGGSLKSTRHPISCAICM